MNGLYGLIEGQNVSTDTVMKVLSQRSIWMRKSFLVSKHCPVMQELACMKTLGDHMNMSMK